MKYGRVAYETCCKLFLQQLNLHTGKQGRLAVTDIGVVSLMKSRGPSSRQYSRKTFQREEKVYKDTK